MAVFGVPKEIVDMHSLHMTTAADMATPNDSLKSTTLGEVGPLAPEGGDEGLKSAANAFMKLVDTTEAQRVLMSDISNVSRFSGVARVQVRLPLSDMDLTVVDGVGTHSWWNGVASGLWEPETFRVFNQEIRSGMVYVGFGEWIGVTGLYAAQRVKKAILMDADPRAYEELRVNVLLNQAAFGNNMHTDQRCISSSRGKVKMRGTGGSGCSIVLQPWLTDSMPEFEVVAVKQPSSNMLSMDLL